MDAADGGLLASWRARPVVVCRHRSPALQPVPLPPATAGPGVARRARALLALRTAAAVLATGRAAGLPSVPMGGQDAPPPRELPLALGVICPTQRPCLLARTTRPRCPNCRRVELHPRRPRAPPSSCISCERTGVPMTLRFGEGDGECHRCNRQRMRRRIDCEHCGRPGRPSARDPDRCERCAGEKGQADLHGVRRGGSQPHPGAVLALLAAPASGRDPRGRAARGDRAARALPGRPGRWAAARNDPAMDRQAGLLPDRSGARERRGGDLSPGAGRGPARHEHHLSARGAGQPPGS
jgi:hypothetical protein